MQTDVLTPGAKALLPKLAYFAQDFYLAGGTALALQINHRVSVDFDLFSDDPIDRGLLRTVEAIFSKSAREILVNNTGELTLVIDGVKCTFLHYPIPPILPFYKTSPLPFLSVKEILATKAYTIGRRGEFKDYVDMHAGLNGNYASLTEVIELARKKYGNAFNDRLFLEQLIYLADVPDAPIVFIGKPIERGEIERYLRDAVSSFNLIR